MRAVTIAPRPRYAGYRMVKMKVGGLTLDEDCRRIESVLDVLPTGS